VLLFVGSFVNPALDHAQLCRGCIIIILGRIFWVFCASRSVVSRSPGFKVRTKPIGLLGPMWVAWPSHSAGHLGRSGLATICVCKHKAAILGIGSRFCYLPIALALAYPFILALLWPDIHALMGRFRRHMALVEKKSWAPAGRDGRILFLAGSMQTLSFCHARVVSSPWPRSVELKPKPWRKR